MKRFTFSIISVSLVISLLMSGCTKENNTPVNLPKTVVTTFAGPNIGSYITGVGPASSFNQPTGVAVDDAGNVFVADQGNNVIRKISPSGIVTTLAGNGHIGSTDGLSTAASFNGPIGIALDAVGDVYVTEYLGYRLRIIRQDYVAQDYIVNTYATNIEYAYGVAVDTIGEAANVYVSNFGTYQIGHITPSGDMIPLAGNGIGSTNGPGYAAKFDGPAGIAFDIVGNIYVADKYNNVIRKISSSGVVTTFAGDGSVGSDNGVGTTAASFTNPTGVAVDKAGNVYVADQGNNLIRKISPAGAVSWLAGTGQIGSANGPGYAASFNHPSGVAVDDSGNVYVADTDNNMIRKISQ